jgi:hypothetical protein
MKMNRITERELVRLLVGGFFLTALSSVMVAVSRDDVAGWAQQFLTIASVQFAGAGLIWVVIRGVIRQPEPEKKDSPALDEDTVPLQISSEEIKSKQLIMSYVARLKQGDSKEARQVILDEMKARNLLPGANLNNMNLEGANLYDTDMRGISLEGCNLQGAYMLDANLSGANLSQANLQGADMSWCNLKGAFMGEANLKGAWLLQANMQEAFVKTTQFDNTTRLPDGTRWSSEVHVPRFVDPRRPDFWRPEPGFFGELPRWYRHEQRNHTQQPERTP